MDKRETMAALRDVGTAQNRKVYGRHGVKGRRFGVSFANLARLKKTIGIDHELACGLWASRNHDARILACMIADPAEIGSGELDAWVRDLGNYVLANAFADLASHSPFAWTKVERWARSRDEWIGRVGWLMIAALAKRVDDVDDDVFVTWLDLIRERVHQSPNRQRDAMNAALIAIGLRSYRLERKALAAARRIGLVEVEHGETRCQTPDAATAIRVKRRRG